MSTLPRKTCWVCQFFVCCSTMPMWSVFEYHQLASVEQIPILHEFNPTLNLSRHFFPAYSFFMHVTANLNKASLGPPLDTVFVFELAWIDAIRPMQNSCVESTPNALWNSHTCAESATTKSWLEALAAWCRCYIYAFHYYLSSAFHECRPYTCHRPLVMAHNFSRLDMDC